MIARSVRAPSPTARTKLTAAAAESPEPSAIADLHDRLALSVLEEFRVIFKSVRRQFSRVEKLAGVTGAQLWVLAEVARQPGIRVTVLARALAIHQSTASNLIERLQAQKLIERRRTDDDQRVVRLFLTATGRRILKRAPGPTAGLLPDALKQLPPTELKSLKEQLVRLTGLMPLKDSRAKATPLSEIG